MTPEIIQSIGTYIVIPIVIAVCLWMALRFFLEIEK